jgi:glycosyltransferase involved in cell wall biosynthesis
MRILLVQNRYYPALGGGEKHTYLLAKYLALDGHEVTIYTSSSLSSKDVYSLALRPPFVHRPQKRMSLPKKEVISNTVVHRYSLNWRFWSLNWIPDMFKALKKTTMDFDLVHAHGYHHSAALVSCYYAKKHGKPFILTGHDLTIPSSLPADVRLFKKLYDKTFGRYLLTNSTGLIALTEDHVEQYAARGGDVRKISIIPNGIELEEYRNQQLDQNLLIQYGISKEDKILLFVGRIEEYKGIQDVIAILPQILESFPETVLVVAGRDYGFKSQLEALIAQSNLAAHVVFTGPLSEEQLVQLYKIASVFVFPSQMEGFGRVLLEAMASGTLCIAYSIPAVRRVIENGINGVLVGNKSELLDRILYYFSHPEKQTEIESAALKSVTAYDIRQIVKATEQVYQKALG